MTDLSKFIDPKKEKISFGLTLSPEDLALLDKLAKHHGTSKVTVVRALIRQQAGAINA